MSTLDVAVIINPLSGSRTHGAEVGRRRAEIARASLSSNKLRGDVVVSEWAGHAVELAKSFKAANVPLVFAWGGDGTINEVGNALAFSEVTLGIIRAGAGNGLAREMGVPPDPAHAIASAVAGPTRRIDAGELQGRLFFNVAGVGFDAVVAHRFNSIPTGDRSLAGYVRAASSERFTFRSQLYAIDADGERLDMQAQAIAFANSRQYGNGAVIAPNARLNDGLLDLVVVKPGSIATDLVRACRLLGGRGLGRQAITRQFRRVEIRSDSPMWIHVDGETFQTADVLVGRVHPNALKVRFPS